MRPANLLTLALSVLTMAGCFVFSYPEDRSAQDEGCTTDADCQLGLSCWSGTCVQTCTGSGDECASGRSCQQGLCLPDEEKLGIGEQCSSSLQCDTGLVCDPTNGRCCGQDNQCCRQPEHCVFQETTRCNNSLVCQGEVLIASCTANMCGSSWAVSPGGCQGVPCALARCEAGQYTAGSFCNAAGTCVSDSWTDCAGGLDCQDGQACTTSCNVTTHEGCRPGLDCVDGTTCQARPGLGVDCAGDDSACDQYGLVCQLANHRCCVVDAVCCGDAGDCPAQALGNVYDGATCTDVTNCLGEGHTPTCSDNVCSFSIDTTDNSGCGGLECRAQSCMAGQLESGATCTSQGGSCPALAPGDCPVVGTACFDGDCRTPYGMGHDCDSDIMCLSGQCDQDLGGRCRGAPGESCRWFTGDGSTDKCAAIIVDPPNEHLSRPNGLCGYGDSLGTTGKCMSAGCVTKACRYWTGDPVTGSCSGLVGNFIPCEPGNPTCVCVNDSAVDPRERSFFNGVDDDGDGLTDAQDPDCDTDSPPAFWGLIERPERGLCLYGGCGDDCFSKVGGCFDEACHFHHCWPTVCRTVQGYGPSQALCTWWDSVADTTNSCDPRYLHARPDGALCGFPGTLDCECRGGRPEETNCENLLDDDLDGDVDDADTDCQRPAGERCFVKLYNGLFDQCSAGPCWCADADCLTGFCLPNPTCLALSDHLCKYALNSSQASGCNLTGVRPDGAHALPTSPATGSCQSGVVTAIGGATQGQACTDWFDCDSGFCLCGNETCTTKRCWNAGDCIGNACNYMNASLQCASLGASVAIPCGDVAELAGKCECRDGDGVPHEQSCDNYVNDDWPIELIPLGAPDWMDMDCRQSWLDEMHGRSRPEE